MTHDEYTPTLKQCLVCQKEQPLQSFISLSNGYSMTNICKKCQKKQQDGGDEGGGGGLQLDSDNKKHTIMRDEEIRLEQKQEAFNALNERHFLSEEKHHKTDAKNTANTQEKQNHNMVLP